MSVSDPLLKPLKIHVYNLTVNQPITDKHSSLRPFCELLEVVLRKGLKQNASLFDFNPKDYWNWLENLRRDVSTGPVKLHPLIDVAIDQVRSTTKVTTAQGRGRYFIRLALQNKLLQNVFEVLVKNENFLLTWYDSFRSFLSNEILSEMLLSLLLQLSELNFELCLENNSFLDETWRIPIYQKLQLVPCKDLGMKLHHVNGRVVVLSLTKTGVAADGNQIEPGDVLDEMFGRSLRNIVKGTIPKLMRKHKDTPVNLSITKHREEDGSTFPPIAELIKLIKRDGGIFEETETNLERQKQTQRKPPHALLPDDQEDEVPVHDDNEKAEYQVQYIGRTVVGQDGGVHQIEPHIQKVLNNDDLRKDSQVMTLALGETDVLLKNRETDEIVFKVSYTEISSCGRRLDSMQYFAYLAGETTCTLAKQFVAYVFKAQSDDEAKTILCSIAQGFDRTHWFV